MTRPRDARGRFLPAAGGDAPPAKATRPAAKPATPRRGKRKSKKAKEAIFFRELSILCNVSSALRRAGMAGQSSAVYGRLGTDPDFRARWHQAIAQSYALLELEMLERHRFGDDRPPPKTEVERRLRAVPTAQAMQLLKLHQSRARGAVAAAPAPRATGGEISRREAREIRVELERKLSEFNRRMGGDG